jgi:hypothetical protein
MVLALAFSGGLNAPPQRGPSGVFRICEEEGVCAAGSPAGGLGGCPYAKGASGKVATEDMAYLLDGLGDALEAGMSRDAVIEAGRYICAAFGKGPRF